jgi:hypothetical protein
VRDLRVRWAPEEAGLPYQVRLITHEEKLTPSYRILQPFSQVPGYRDDDVVCGASFEVSRDPRTGKRSDALFCGSRCRVGHYRDRIEQARRMGSNGMTAKRIAHEMNAEVATVQGWLGNMQTPGAKARRAGPKTSLRPKVIEASIV